MDFFSSVSQVSSTTYSDPTAAFADAIAARFNAGAEGGGIHTVLSARLLTPRSSMIITTPTPITRRRYTSIKLGDVSQILKDPSGLLLLDIRSPTAYVGGHLPHSLSLSVPSTLLKRPTFPLNKLAQMLPTAIARTEFLSWPNCRRILVYEENDDESMIHALLDKFTREGFRGEMGFIEGGYRAVDSSMILQPAATDLQNSPSIMETGTSRTAANPFFDAVRQNAELAHGITIRIPLRISAGTRARVAAEPLVPSWIASVASRALPLASESQSEPEDVNGHDLAESLALQFHRIELAEQRRLQGVMAHHAKETQAHSASAALSSRNHPFSITAGVEKGAKNRYRHIWPFEHARVRLAAPADETDDYVNASHVHPIGTRRHYIATQGPLDATFSDFWTLVWEQDVRVVVMITREIENAQVKCGRYWPLETFYTSGSTSSTAASPSMTYGAITVTLLSTSPAPQPPKTAEAGFFASRGDQAGERETITRIIHLHHGPSGQTRRLTHLQHVDWPDMDVPSSPSGIIRLLQQVDEARKQNLDGDDDEDRRPVLLHCSAGVGRTGGFIAADAILDAIRHDVRATLKSQAVSSVPAMTMDVDPPVDMHAMENVHTVVGSPTMSPFSSPPPPSGAATRAWADAVSGMGPSALTPPLRGTRQRRTLDEPSKRVIDMGLDVRSSSAPSIFTPMFVHSSAVVMSSPPTQRLGSPFTFGSPQSTGFASPPHTATAFSLPPSVSSLGDSPPPSSAGSAADIELSSPVPPRPAEVQPAPVDPPKFPASSNDPTMDYTLPRGSMPGPELGNLHEPICAVIQDMREQRMSLCQSLRQYVFVHAVVVEGALAVIDEERARAGSLAPLNTSTSLTDDEHIGGKRGASPTELIKEDRQSGFALAKRPSVKRKITTPGDTASKFTTIHSLTIADVRSS